MVIISLVRRAESKNKMKGVFHSSGGVLVGGL